MRVELFHQIGAGQYIIVGIQPLFTPFRREGRIRFNSDEMEEGVGLSQFQHHLCRPDVHTHAHAGDEGGVARIYRGGDLIPEPVLGGGLGEQDALGAVVGEAASVLVFFGFGHVIVPQSSRHIPFCDVGFTLFHCLTGSGFLPVTQSIQNRVQRLGPME